MSPTSLKTKTNEEGKAKKGKNTYTLLYFFPLSKYIIGQGKIIKLEKRKDKKTFVKGQHIFF